MAWREVRVGHWHGDLTQSLGVDAGSGSGECVGLSLSALCLVSKARRCSSYTHSYNHMSDLVTTRQVAVVTMYSRKAGLVLAFVVGMAPRGCFIPWAGGTGATIPSEGETLVNSDRLYHDCFTASIVLT